MDKRLVIVPRMVVGRSITALLNLGRRVPGPHDGYLPIVAEDTQGARI